MAFGEKQKLDCLRILIKPLVKFALRHSISVQQITETVKQAVVELGADEMVRCGKKVNVSRLSAMTGLHRRDVIRLMEEGDKRELPAPLASRVVSQWENDRRFLGKNGRPRILSLAPERNEFVKLLGAVNTDLNPGTVLFELERSGLVERRSNSVKLLRAHVVPKGDVLEGFRILGQDADDLIRTVEENVTVEAAERSLHGRTDFDNISEKDLKTIRAWLVREGGEFHKKVRKYLAGFDHDVNPALQGRGGARVSLSTFSRIEGSQS